MRAKCFVAAVCLLAVLLGGYAFYTHTARKNAPVFYFKIAPVDPRALLSGDYMALAYEVENNSSGLRWRGVRTVYVAEKDVVQTQKTARPLEIAFQNGRFKLPHQFYFEEGTGKKYEGAVYAQMQRLPDGRFLIKALTDEKFNEIK